MVFERRLSFRLCLMACPSRLPKNSSRVEFPPASFPLKCVGIEIRPENHCSCTVHSRRPPPPQTAPLYHEDRHDSKIKLQRQHSGRLPEPRTPRLVAAEMCSQPLPSCRAHHRSETMFSTGSTLFLEQRLAESGTLVKLRPVPP